MDDEYLKEACGKSTQAMLNTHYKQQQINQSSFEHTCLHCLL